MMSLNDARRALMRIKDRAFNQMAADQVDLDTVAGFLDTMVNTAVIADRLSADMAAIKAAISPGPEQFPRGKFLSYPPILTAECGMTCRGDGGCDCILCRVRRNA